MITVRALNTVRDRVAAEARNIRSDAGDDVLVAAIAKGDHAAFRALFDRYARKVAAFAQRITRRADLTEDIVNETMLTVWRTAARFERRSKASTWIFGITYRVSLAALRRQRRDDGVPLDAEGAPEPSYDTRSDLAQKDAVRKALGALAPEQRAVVELTFFLGHSTAEIAQILGCPQGTVKTRMFAARRKMKAVLEGTPT